MFTQQTAKGRFRHRWERQIVARDWSHAMESLSPRLAIGHMTPCRTTSNLIDVCNFIITLLHYDLTAKGTPKVPLRGFVGSKVPWGVKWGGTKNSLFEKDLSLSPVAGARGRRLDSGRRKLLALGLELDCQLWRAVTESENAKTVDQLRLPNLWAAFEPKTALRVYADGPELETLCYRRRQTPAGLLDQYRREHRGLVLFPLNWVSHHWGELTRVFADLHRHPKCQIVRVSRLLDDLHGFRGAGEFDFRQTRFAKRKPRRRRRGHRWQVAA